MITAMGDVMREAYKRNWITTRDGNCAVKIKGSNTIYLTPSGIRKTLICPEMIVRLTLGEEFNFIPQWLLLLANGICTTGFSRMPLLAQVLYIYIWKHSGCHVCGLGPE